MEKVIEPIVKLIYQGKDITNDISAYLISVDYTDCVDSESDEFSFTVSDSNDLWKGPWFPVKGDKIQGFIGYENQMLDCGTFTVDEIEFSGPPDTVTIRALAASVNSAIRTKNSKAYENQTIGKIARDICKKYGFSLVDGGSSSLLNIQIIRETQSRETDLSFLHRIGFSYGLLFSVRDSKMTFTSVYDIEKGDSKLKLDRTDLLSFSFKDKATKVFKKAKLKHKNAKKRTVVSREIQANDIGNGSSTKTSDDILEIRCRAESDQQAEAKARAMLHHFNSKSTEGYFETTGKPYLVAGNNFNLSGFASLSGKWTTIKSHHTVSSGGYKTTVDGKLIGVYNGDKLTIGDVLFDNDSYVIKPAGYAELAKVIAYMKTNDKVLIQVGGHTDSNASEAYNFTLSKNRANACMVYLIRNGILATRLTAKGFGESIPVASNATPEGRAKNRRTEFVVVGLLP